MKKENKLPANVYNDSRLKMVKRVTRLMDEQFSIGGFKFGLDPLLNLMPFAGDLSTYIISVALIITMFQYGASGRLVAKMILNATLDAVIGAIPVLGWIFDFTYKANSRNLKLLDEHYVEGKHRGSAKPVIFSVLLSLLVVLFVIVFVTYKLFQWIDGQLGL